MVIISEVVIVKENEEDDLEAAIEPEKRNMRGGTEEGIEIDEGAEREAEVGIQIARGDDETERRKGQAVLIGDV